ncbi:putative ribosomal N-acetyltransferase [Nymphaea thermarum]|nr:putative ribosomal N-acetyltransferase [Nymphaea thermarum]
MEFEDGEEGFTISLRPFELTDADDVMGWATDARVARFCRWMPYTSRDDAAAFIRDVAIPHSWCRAICLAGRPVGSISVEVGEGSSACRGEIGYVLAHRYWGKGIATTAVRKAVQAAFAAFPALRRIEGLVDSENFGSQRVLEKCGFVREGVLRKYMLLKGQVRDMVIFSILLEDIMQE